MKLYHYSKKRYDVLKSRRVQGVCTKEEIKEAEDFAIMYHSGGPYIDSLSFFFDPIPYILLPKIFKNGHHTWVKGNELFEYVINVDVLEKDIKYYVTETPDDLKDLDKIDDIKWDKDPNYSISYFKARFKRKKATGEIGVSLSKLKEQISIYKGGTEASYIAASKRPDFIDNQDKYAASVPHVMIYPNKGIINYESVRTITMGVSNDPLSLEDMKEQYSSIPSELIESANNDPVLKGFIGKDSNGIPICKDSIIIGFFKPCEVQHEGKSYWRTGNIYVSPEFRNQGLGTKAVIDFFLDKPFGLAWIAFDNASSMAVFKKAGFRKVPTVTKLNPRNKILYLWLKEPAMESIVSKW